MLLRQRLDANYAAAAAHHTASGQVMPASAGPRLPAQGDRVLFAKYCGTAVRGEEVVLLSEKDNFSIIEDPRADNDVSGGSQPQPDTAPERRRSVLASQVVTQRVTSAKGRSCTVSAADLDG